MRNLRTAVLTGVLVAGLTSAAAADEMRVVTSGFITWEGGQTGRGDFAFFGDDFAIEGGAVDDGANPAHTFFFTPPGTVVEDVAASWVGLDIRGRNPVATVDGTAYDIAAFEGTIALNTGPVTVPSSGGEVTIQAPFSFARDARLEGYLQTPTHVAPPAFAFGLLGGGTATITLLRNPVVDSFFHVRTRWDFSSSQPAPTPEPASVLLLGTGLAAIAARLRKRRA